MFDLVMICCKHALMDLATPIMSFCHKKSRIVCWHAPKKVRPLLSEALQLWIFKDRVVFEYTEVLLIRCFSSPTVSVAHNWQTLYPDSAGF